MKKNPKKEWDENSDIKKKASSNIRLQHAGMKTSCLGLREQEITSVQKEDLQAQNFKKQVELVLVRFMYFERLSKMFSASETI